MKQLFIFLMLTTASFSFAQTEIIAFETMDGKWGYLNPDGEVIIKDQYIDAHSFTSAGMAIVHDGKERRWKLIDQKNIEIELPGSIFESKTITYGGQKGFRDELLMIEVDKKHGYINGAGKVIHEPIYDHVSTFKEKHAIGEIGKDFYILDKTGNSTEVLGDITLVSHVINGFAPYRNKAKQFGFINENGEIVIEAKFKKVGYFYNGIAWARTMEGLIGFINTRGDWIIDPQFKRVTNFNSGAGVVRVLLGDKLLFLKKSGETFSVEGMVTAGEFSDGLAWVRVGEKFGYINTMGEWVVKPEYSNAKNLKDGRGLVKKGSLWGLIDSKGKLIAQPVYEKFGDFQNELMAARLDGKWGFINEFGKLIIEPKFEAVRAFKNEYAAVRVNGAWGLIDKSGKFVIKPQYHRLKDVEIID